MEVASGKRPAETDKPVNTYAVCATCNRLSSDLRVCDKCGTTLSDDNAAHCYSAEPKRPCLGTSASDIPSTQCNGVSSANTSDAAVSTSSSPSTSNNAVRPQALYVNVNNQAFPVLGVATTTSASAAPRPSVVGSAHVNSSVSNPNPTAILTTSHAAVPATRTIQSVQTGIHPRPTSIGSATMTQITLPTYNLQPPPNLYPSSVARPAFPGLVSTAMHAPVQSATTVTPVVTSSYVFQVTAIQIRLGAKKFKPLTSVTFKDDGVLFTLTGYSYAPVLLNARAIIKCKANLNTFSFPVIFLFLEGSCMRQLRNIFGLTSNEFSPTSNVEMKRSIAIFPIYAAEGKSQSQVVMYSVRRCFEAMLRRYPRNTKILEEITNDQALDILLELRPASEQDDGRASPNIPVSTSGASSVAVSSPVVAATAQNVLISAASYPAPQVANTRPQVATTAPAVSSSLGALASVARAATMTHVSRPQAAAPVLQIPTDQSRWQLMQKGLIAGGVYHVMMPDGGRQYCLWNGKQLVPCLVQNTEVQLGCMKLRIGSLLAQCVGQVRVRADQGCGIFFTMKHEVTGSQEVSLVPDEINTCQICFGSIPVVFITLNAAGADNLRKRLKLSAHSDPTYSPLGSAVYRRYIILFLNSVNRDQEDALKQMKFTRSGVSSSLFDTIDVSRGMVTLAQIKLDTTNALAVTQYLKSKSLTGVQGFDKLMNEVASSISGGAVTEDDDDDVIMTQEEVGMKCPYTQQVMKFPMRNKICGHNYERDAIREFILRKKGNAKCPYAGCGNLIALTMEDLVENAELRAHINNQSTVTDTQT